MIEIVTSKQSTCQTTKKQKYYPNPYKWHQHHSVMTSLIKYDKRPYLSHHIQSQLCATFRLTKEPCKLLALEPLGSS